MVIRIHINVFWVVTQYGLVDVRQIPKFQTNIQT
jgi:hypothetical protein